jgi:hypothetical protein
VAEDESRHLSGLLVDPPVGEVIAPGGGLGIEVEQVAKAATGPEATPYEADRSLHASFLIASPHVAGHHREATSCAGIFQEPRIEHGGERGMREDDGLHVVEDVGGGAALEELQATIHTPQEGPHGLAECELDIEIPRVAQDGDEGTDSTRHPG